MIIKEDYVVSTYWLMAHIILTFPGRDGNTRVVNLNTKTGIYKRLVAKLVLLVPQDYSKFISSFGRNVQDT